MSLVKIDHLTKKFAENKGIFDISFDIREGEVFGFLGPNGAGKTTTIRHLLGFTQPQSGKSTILNMDCWGQSKEIQKQLGYLPAEIAFPSNMTGTKLIRHIADMRGLRNMGKAEKLIASFQLDPSAPIKRMSKGMKQKVGIVCAFMHDPKVIILDEPTTGLDPLMQSVFVELIQQEKQSGKSILMSSHLFEEIEGTCDRIGIIKQGKIMSIMDSKSLRQLDKTTYKIEFLYLQDFVTFQKEGFKLSQTRNEDLQVTIELEDSQINELLRVLSKLGVKSIRESKSSLEEHFMGFYKGEE